MIRGIINSPLPIHQRSNTSIFVSIGQFVMVGREFEPTRHESIGEGCQLRLSSYLLFFCETQRENPSNLSKNQCVFPLYCHGISVSFFTPSWWTEINKSAPRSLARFDRCTRLS